MNLKIKITKSAEPYSQATKLLLKAGKKKKSQLQKLATAGGLGELFLPHLWQTFEMERTVENLITERIHAQELQKLQMKYQSAQLHNSQ